MVKLKGPLFSFAARGSFGPRLTFSSRRSGPQVRHQRANTDAQSASQSVRRGYFQTAMGWWATLQQSEKDEWLVLGRQG